jgi:hypothetical protein
MVQVQINVISNVDLRAAQLVPSTFSVRMLLTTAHGQRIDLCSIEGHGGVDEAHAAALAWVCGNMLEYNNPSCRPLRYRKAQEQ